MGICSDERIAAKRRREPDASGNGNLPSARAHPPMAEKRRQWEQQGLYLYYLPAYSPELNRIEILWKQAKYFWRRFRYLAGDSLLSLELGILRQSHDTQHRRYGAFAVRQDSASQ